MAEVYNTTFKLKRGLEEAWGRVNPILAQGEPGFVIDTNRLKVGDGVTAWNELPFVGAQSYIARPTCNDFPAIGQDNMFYVDLSNNAVYVWFNYSYKQISAYNEVDTELSAISNNPIANSAVTNALADTINSVIVSDTAHLTAVKTGKEVVIDDSALVALINEATRISLETANTLEQYQGSNDTVLADYDTRIESLESNTIIINVLQEQVNNNSIELNNLKTNVYTQDEVDEIQASLLSLIANEESRAKADAEAKLAEAKEYADTSDISTDRLVQGHKELILDGGSVPEEIN